MAQWSRILTAFSKELSLVPSTQVGLQPSLAPGNLIPSSRLHGYLHAHTQTHTDRQISCKKRGVSVLCLINLPMSNY